MSGLDLTLVGIGTGNPEHLTLQAIRALRGAEVIAIPRKAGKADLAEIRRAICAEVAPEVPVREFDLPVRDEAIADYVTRVERWHDAIAAVWAGAIGGAGRAALLVWGDPSLYDSTLRIAARLAPARLRVIPGITSVQALTAAHAIPLNTIDGPVTITTGRRLRAEGWPEGAETLVVMLDAECAFQRLDPEGVAIWWAAFAGMPEEVAIAGPLAEAGPRIVAARAAARAAHGWVMDIYLMRRSGTPGNR